MPGDEGLSNPGTEEDLNEERDEEVNQAKEKGAADEIELKTFMETITSDVSGTNQRLEFESAKQRTEAVQLGEPQVANESVRVNDEAVDRLRTELHEMVRQNGANTTEAQRNYNLNRWLVIATLAGAMGTVTAVVYTAVHDAVHKQADNLGLSEDEQRKIAALADAWLALPDADYWDTLADYADDPKNKLTTYDQILFMNYTIDLSPIGTPWYWNDGQNLVDYVDDLYSAYAQNGSCGDMYRYAASMLYDDAAIPRAVTAELLRYALTRIFASSGSTKRVAHA